MQELTKYDAACAAVAAARSVDEVRAILNTAEAQRAYARMAKNRTLEGEAIEIRLRAERRLGAMMAAQKDAVGLSKGGRPSKTGLTANPVPKPAPLPTLADAGIDKNLATRARTAAGMSDERFEEIVAESRARITAAADLVTAKLIQAEAEPPPPKPTIPRDHSPSDPVSLDRWQRMSPEERAEVMHAATRSAGARFNEQTGDDIEWAQWSWNPITGCEHTCPYCYARDIATSARMASVYPFGFAPAFHPRRLTSPSEQRVPDAAKTDARYRNVFTGSMADMFGRWVPDEWVQAVLERIEHAPYWNFLCLTKFPKRMAEFEIPRNAWMGTSVDLQARVAAAEAGFADVGAAVKWLSCEPLIEPLRFQHLDRFNWIVIGGASRSGKTPEWRPPFEWVSDLVRQARDAGLKVYFKTNLGVENRILELPFDAPIAADPVEAPAVFHYLGRGT